MHRSCNDSVIELSPLSSYAVPAVVKISHACLVHLVFQYSLHFSQLDLNSEFGGHSKGRMNYGVSLLCSNGKK